MGYIEVVKVNPDELDTCDQCGKQGLKESGELLKDIYGEAIMWICFNCSYLRNRQLKNR